MTGLLFVTARSTDVKDLNRLLLELRDWQVSSSSPQASPAGSQAQQFLDRFRFVTKHNPRALVTNSHRRSSASSSSSLSCESSQHQEHAHGTFPPVPPSATFANSWVDRSAEEIEGFMNMLASDVADDMNNNNNNKMSLLSSEKETGGPSFLERRDSGYSTCSDSSTSSTGAAESCYNASMYLMVDEAGLSTGTATLGCRRAGAGAAGSWDRVRGIPWTEVCSVWRAVQASRSVECLFGPGTKQLLQIQSAPADTHESREVSYQRPVGQEAARASTPPRDCRRRDMELSMWRECGLV